MDGAAQRSAMGASRVKLEPAELSRGVRPWMLGTSLGVGTSSPEDDPAELCRRSLAPPRRNETARADCERRVVERADTQRRMDELLALQQELANVQSAKAGFKLSVHDVKMERFQPALL